MSFQEFLISKGYSTGILDPRWRNLSQEDKFLLKKEWEHSKKI